MIIAGGSRASVENPLDCHDKIDNVLVINLNICSVAETLNNFVYHLHQNDSCQ